MNIDSEKISRISPITDNPGAPMPLAAKIPKWSEVAAKAENSATRPAAKSLVIGCFCLIAA